MSYGKSSEVAKTETVEILLGTVHNALQEKSSLHENGQLRLMRKPDSNERLTLIGRERHVKPYEGGSKGVREYAKIVHVIPLSPQLAFNLCYTIFRNLQTDNLGIVVQDSQRSKMFGRDIDTTYEVPESDVHNLIANIDEAAS